MKYLSVASNLFILAMPYLTGCADRQCNNCEQSPATAIHLQEQISGYFAAGSTESSHRYLLPVTPGQIYSLDLNYGVGYDTWHSELYIRVESEDGAIVLGPKYVFAQRAKYFEFSPATSTVVIVVYPLSQRLNDLSSLNDYIGYTLMAYPSTKNGLIRDDKLEPNNTPSTAAPLILQSRQSGELEGTEDHADYYSVETVGDEIYTAELTFNEGTATGANTELRVRIDSGDDAVVLPEQKVSWHQTGYFELAAKNNSPLIVKIFPGEVAEYRRFQYTLTFLPAAGNGLVQDVATYEPNNSPTTAYPIALGQVINSELTAVYLPEYPTGTEDHFDFFSVPVVAGGVYDLNISSLVSPTVGASKELRVAVTSSHGSILLGEKIVPYSGTGSYQFAALQNGLAIVKVYSDRNFYAKYYQYRFSIAVP